MPSEKVYYSTPFDSFLFTGPDPHWTPARESQARESCDICGGAIKVGRSWEPNRERDPIRPYETLAVACGGCLRSTYEGRLQGKIYASNDARPGKMAKKVVGPPSPECDAYLRHQIEMGSSGIPDDPAPEPQEPPDA